jgi:hypothetical protein
MLFAKLYVMRSALLLLAMPSITGCATNHATAPVSGALSATDAAGETVNFATVAGALDGLKQIPTVAWDVNGKKWIVFADPQSESIWSFVPQGHYAYPAVARQQWRGSTYWKIEFLCEASGAACTQFRRDVLTMIQQDLN